LFAYAANVIEQATTTVAITDKFFIDPTSLMKPFYPVLVAVYYRHFAREIRPRSWLAISLLRNRSLR
jgi:hypothetical protein